MPNDVKGYIVTGSVFWDVFLGALGGFISYIFNYQKQSEEMKRSGELKKIEFSISSMLIYIFLGMFIGYLTGTLLEPKTYARDALVAMGGFSAFSILVVADSRFTQWVIDKFNKRG